MKAQHTVSSLTLVVKQALAEAVGLTTVEGEISGLTRHRSGHWYFTLQDPGATLNCVMFKGHNRWMRWQPEIGDRVVVAGELDVYAPQGRYSLIARRMSRAGEGDAAARLEALKRRLAEEGLLDPSRKRPLPQVPRCIGVATSPTGAALQDILRVLDRRFPGLLVILAPCRVQGDAAPAEVQAALQALVDDGRADVIIVGRGGGSAEDLAAFNDESLARAVAACPVPVVAAVGHETDVSVVDLVADVRAATPSHAAELVVPEKATLLFALEDLDDRLRAAMVRRVSRGRDRLAAVRLRSPEARVRADRVRLEHAVGQLRRAGSGVVHDRRALLERRCARLHALSPLGVLGRGYAVVLRDGLAVRDAAGLAADDALTVRFARGEATVRVTSASAAKDRSPG